MADLTRLQNSQPVQITDDSTQVAVLTTTVPGSTVVALAIREVQRGQQTSANSMPVVLASDQTAVSQVVSSFTNKSTTVGTAAAALTTASTASTIGVQLRSAIGNVGKIYIGSSTAVTAGTTAATDGMVLYAGDSFLVPVNNANLIFGISDTAGNTLFYNVF